MWMLFEDADNTPVSNLIRYAYEGTKVKIGFVGGSGNFISFIDNNINNINETIILYFDLIPDNPDTGRNYRYIRKKLKVRSNTVVYPNICLEYIILKAFTNNVPSLEDVLFKCNYSVCKHVTSAEKYYKYLLDNSKDCLSFGGFSTPNEHNSTFYRVDCPCTTACSDIVSYVKISKVYDLVYSLPVFFRFGFIKQVTDADVNNDIATIEYKHNALVHRVAKERNWTNQKMCKALV